MKQHLRVIIVGGGLSGLTLAYLLSKEGISATILEASSRLGGRIQTLKGKNDTPLELGATWFSDIHQKLISILEELGLKKYPQYARGKSLFQTKSFEPPQEFYIPETAYPSYRIVGGTARLIDALRDRINPQQIHLDTRVVSVNDKGDEVMVETQNGMEFRAHNVVLCLPPQLVGSRIRFSPELPDDVSKLLPTVQTWMAGSIKFVLEYARPFWREKGYSGMLYSHSGIITEMYDHTNFEENKFGFTGFLNGGSSSYGKETRKQLVLKQLNELLGKESSHPLIYSEKVWVDEFILDGNQVVSRPHQNNGHPTLQRNYLNGKLYFSGTESVPEYSGYMEGAIISAKKACHEILEDK